MGGGGTDSRNPEKVESAGLQACSDEEPGEEGGIADYWDG